VLAFGVLASVIPLLFAGIIVRYGWFDDVWTLIRVLTSIMLLTPPVQFVFTFAWIKMRDSLWGVFGSRKSVLRALLYEVAIAVVVMAAFVGLACTARWNHSAAIDSVPLAGAAGAIFAFVSYIFVRVSGPATIRDTLWAMLDTEAA
jgi:hypothetical protein